MYGSRDRGWLATGRSFARLYMIGRFLVLTAESKPSNAERDMPEVSLFLHANRKS